MFSFFKKKESSNQRNGENTVANTNSVAGADQWNGFPSAEKIREKSISAWKNMTINEILIAIEKESKEGWNNVELYRVNIPEDIIKGLEERGYTVKKDTVGGAPKYTIKW